MDDVPASGAVSSLHIVEQPILFVDGVCNLCNAAVRFSLRHERSTVLKFANLQSETYESLPIKTTEAHLLSTVILISGDGVFYRSDAIVMLLRLYCRQPWSTFGLVIGWIPKPLRDFGYAVVATNRYRFFGKQAQCILPTGALKHRFLP